MKQIVYISSLTHSGSTLLDLILGGHPRFIGLGEVARFAERRLENSREAICSCGQRMDDCLFWSQVAARFQAHEGLNFEQKYRLVFEIFEEIFGPDAIPVDSSKHLSPLDVLHSSPHFDLKILYLLKDVRSFTVSRLDNLKRKEGQRWYKRIPGQIFWDWYARNRKMRHFFIDRKMEVFQVGYEELCLHPGKIVGKICDFLGETMEPAMLTLQESGSHVLRGNRMRYQKEKAEMSYDHRWFLRNEWILPAFLFPHIMRYNAREVYRNNTDAIWRQ
jgi:hypothetical protein